MELIIAGLVCLGVAYAMELTLSKRTDQTAPAIGKWVSLGTVAIDGPLVISHEPTLRDKKIMTSVPRGTYKASVEQFLRGNDHYVAALKLTGAEVCQVPVREELKYSVDTGFLLLLCTDVPIAAEAQAAQSRILSEPGRSLDAELLVADGLAVGLITSTGAGDGQYGIRLSVHRDGYPELCVRFLDDLAEI